MLAWLLEQGTAPEIIPCGSKIMSMDHKSLGIRIIDSFNFLPMGLAKLPACFGFKELKKGYFPHFFNTRANQGYKGPLPEPAFYGANTMSSAARTAFLNWHQEHASEVFDFKKEILEYCRWVLFFSREIVAYCMIMFTNTLTFFLWYRSDVDILRRCCLEFRKQFLDVAGVDPFE